ncbi:LysE family translocator [Pseudoroseomonas cervicalis]|uniref:LysE family translocator n=1 Tax=Teichococcus cervicalis TaxID=204525 RepID=UPI00277E785A|nr:LysE family translocator [Pseudoroseomonas cervicalis]MDQ1079940.1 threonine/homoserine/homoserine lactone efflux protein [Pseudoroseomonas cervicalis]
MLPTATLLTFSLLALGLAVTPGPNMLYLVSRSVAQGPRAGLVSLAGCQAGSLLIMLGAAAGVTAALLAIPYAYDVLRLGGAAYLLWLAWQSIRPGGQPLFAPRPLPAERDGKLFAVGMATALLNPKVAIFYVAVMPPFMDPALGSLFWQGVTLGLGADHGRDAGGCAAGAGCRQRRPLLLPPPAVGGAATLDHGRRAGRAGGQPGPAEPAMTLPPRP